MTGAPCGSAPRLSFPAVLRRRVEHALARRELGDLPQRLPDVVVRVAHDVGDERCAEPPPRAPGAARCSGVSVGSRAPRRLGPRGARGRRGARAPSSSSDASSSEPYAAARARRRSARQSSARAARFRGRRRPRRARSAARARGCRAPRARRARRRRRRLDRFEAETRQNSRRAMRSSRCRSYGEMFSSSMRFFRASRPSALLAVADRGGFSAKISSALV